MLILPINHVTEEEIRAEFFSVVHSGVEGVVSDPPGSVDDSQLHISSAFRTNAAFAVSITFCAEIFDLKNGIKYSELSSGIRQLIPFDIRHTLT